MKKTIYRWNGQYFGFIYNERLFDKNSNYLGWADSNEVYKSNGVYLGEIVDEHYVLRRLSKNRMRKSPRITPMTPMTPMNKINRMGKMSRMGFIDALNEFQ